MVFSFGSGLFGKRQSSHSSAIVDHESNSPPDRTFIRRPIQFFSLLLSFFLPDVAAGEMKLAADTSFIQCPTSRPSPELSSPSSPVSDLRPVRRCGWQSILYSDPLLSVVRFPWSPALPLARFLRSSTIAAPGAFSHPVQKPCPIRSVYHPTVDLPIRFHPEFKHFLTRMNQASSLWMYHYNLKIIDA